MEAIITISIILLIIIIGLALFTLYNINMAGMSVDTFYKFVLANVKLQKLHKFIMKYEKLPKQDQIIFIKEAKEVFDAYEKVPTILWEEDYARYMLVLERYQKLRQEAWKNKTPLSQEEFKKIITEVNESAKGVISSNSTNLNKIRVKTIPLKSQKGYVNTKFLIKLFVITLGYLLLKLGKI